MSRPVRQRFHTYKTCSMMSHVCLCDWMRGTVSVKVSILDRMDGLRDIAPPLYYIEALLSPRLLGPMLHGVSKEQQA